MNTLNTLDATRSELQSRLADAGTDFRRQDVARTLRRAVAPAARLLLTLGGAIAMIAIALRWTRPGATGGQAILVLLSEAALGAAVLRVLVPIVRAARASASLALIAQRLDRRQSHDHNRICTALELATSDEPSPFARLAIDDGLAQLRAASTASPPPGKPGVRAFGRLVGALVIFAALMAASFWLVGTRPTPNVIASSADESLAANDGLSISTLSAATSPNKAAATPTSQPSTNADARSSSTTDASSATANQATASAAASPAAAGNMNAAEGQSEVAAATPAAPKSNQMPTGDRDAPDVRPPLRAPSETAVASGGSGGATGDRATSGASARSNNAGGSPPSRGALSMPGTSPPDARDGPLIASDSAAGEAPADEQPPMESSAGATPLRQDRSAPGSRELGQSGTEGGQGNGRGGPGDVKKTRGAGAVFLSVPLPDLIAARLLRGPSQITRRALPPQPTELPSPPAADAAARVGDESPIDRFDVSTADVEIVRRYLDALRREPDDSPAARPQGVPQP